ncbi:MAG: hypothetical protein AB7F65_09550 [Dehalococcoidia bacterium]
MAYWPGHGPVQTPRGLVPVHVTGPERYVPGPHGPALLIERASTNLVSNPRGGAGSIAPWIADGADLAPEAIVDPTAPHGTAIKLAGHSGNVARIYEPLEAQAPSLAQGAPYSVRFHARALNAAAIGEPLQALLWETGGPSGNTVTASVDATFTADWVEHQFTGTIQADGRSGFQFLAGPPYTLAEPGAEYAFADVAVEFGESTSYVDGSLGDGYVWEALEHSSPSSRLSSSAVTDVGAPLPGMPGTIVLVLRPGWSQSSTRQRTLIATETLRLRFDGAGQWCLGDGAAESTLPATHAAGESIVLFAGWSSGMIRLAVGEAEDARTSARRFSPERLWIGSSTLGTEASDASIESVGLVPYWPSLAMRSQAWRN